MSSVEAPVIRAATAADLSALVESDAYAEKHAQRRACLAAAIDRGECLAALAGPRPVGYILLNYSFFGRGFVPLVAVAPSMRRQGIAQLLFAAAESQCETEALFTSTNASNLEARRLFERFGFQPSGRIENLDAGDPELVYFKRCAAYRASANLPSSAHPTASFAVRRSPLMSNVRPSTMSSATAVEVAREFWRLMATNDFHSVACVLAPEFVLEWPQSKERIRGAERFARMNHEYPAQGRWQFTINRLVGGESEAVSDVTVTDAAQTARAISFFTVAQGKVTRLVEFWPQPYAAPSNRVHLVEAME
jgi:ribosomal protein S18 acetylase RimI-like enzyme